MNRAVILLIDGSPWAFRLKAACSSTWLTVEEGDIRAARDGRTDRNADDRGAGRAQSAGGPAQTLASPAAVRQWSGSRAGLARGVAEAVTLPGDSRPPFSAY